MSSFIFISYFNDLQAIPIMPFYAILCYFDLRFFLLANLTILFLTFRFLLTTSLGVSSSPNGERNMKVGMVRCQNASFLISPSFSLRSFHIFVTPTLRLGGRPNRRGSLTILFSSFPPFISSLIVSCRGDLSPLHI